VPFFKKPKPIDASGEGNKAEAKGPTAVASEAVGKAGAGPIAVIEEKPAVGEGKGAPAEKAGMGQVRVEDGQHVLVRLQALEASDMVSC
jgi:hypothetical protein